MFLRPLLNCNMLLCAFRNLNDVITTRIQIDCVCDHHNPFGIHAGLLISPPCAGITGPILLSPPPHFRFFQHTHQVQTSMPPPARHAARRAAFFALCFVSTFQYSFPVLSTIACDSRSCRLYFDASLNCTYSTASAASNCRNQLAPMTTNCPRGQIVPWTSSAAQPSPSSQL